MQEINMMGMIDGDLKLQKIKKEGRLYVKHFKQRTQGIHTTET